MMQIFRIEKKKFKKTIRQANNCHRQSSFPLYNVKLENNLPIKIEGTEGLGPIINCRYA